MTDDFMIQNDIGVEVVLEEEDDFLKVRETLERIGIASFKDKKFFPSCNILHKRNKYYICHYKSLFILDKKPSTISESDIQRRNAIALLLEDWGLLKVLNRKDYEENKVDVSQLRILKYGDKNNWEICPKYNIGNKRKTYK
jgi:hypothetical protein